MKNPGVYKRSNILNSDNGNSKTCFSGQTSSIIKNKIPSSPPLFLRSGFMIFTNIPKQRSKFLDNKFFVTAALNSEGKAVNRFLTISNF